MKDQCRWMVPWRQQIRRKGSWRNTTDAWASKSRSPPQKNKMSVPLSFCVNSDALTTILSALYAKLLVVLGMAFPITEIISPNVRPFFYQGFYLYLYLGSIAFLSYMYATLVREKAVSSIINSYRKYKKTN